MSNEVVDLYRKWLAESGHEDPRTDRMITVELGGWAKQNDPDLFNRFPKFGQDWGAIREANAPGLMSELGRSIKAGSAGLGSTALGGLALLTDSDMAMDGARYLEGVAAKNAPTIGTLEDIGPGRSGLADFFSRDALRYGIAKVGGAAPSVAESVVTGLAGAAIGSAAAPGPGTVAGAATGIMAKGLIKSAIRQMVKKKVGESVARTMATRGLIGEATEEGIEKALIAGSKEVADLVGRQAMAIGARRGLGTASAVNSYLLNAGEVYNTTEDRALAIPLGLVAAVPDTILPNLVLRRLFPNVSLPKAKEMGKSYVADRANKALRAAGMPAAEAPTEAFQQAVNVVGRNLKEGRDAFSFTDEDYVEMREAAISGAAGGGLAAGSVLIQPSQPPAEQTPKPTNPAQPPVLRTEPPPLMREPPSLASDPVASEPSEPTAPAREARVSPAQVVNRRSDEENAARLAELKEATELTAEEQEELELLKALGPTLPVQATDNPPPKAVPAPAGDVLFTVQRTQTVDGRTIPGYVQVDYADDAGGRQSIDIKDAPPGIPAPPEWMPTGQYTRAEIDAAIQNGPPEGAVPTPKIKADVDPTPAKPFEFGPRSQQPGYYPSKPIGLPELEQHIRGTRKGDKKGNRAVTNTAVAFRAPDGRVVLAGVTLPASVLTSSGKNATGALAVQRMGINRKKAREVQVGGNQPAPLWDVVEAGYQPLAVIPFEQSGKIFETFEDVSQFEGSLEASQPTEAPVAEPAEVQVEENVAAPPLPEPTPAPATPPSVTLPPALAGAKPRYKQSKLNFESDLDKAAYITAQKKRSKRDQAYLDAVMEQTGMTEQQVRAHGAKVRSTIGTLANEDGTITVPAVELDAAPPPVATRTEVGPPAQVDENGVGTVQVWRGITGNGTHVEPRPGYQLTFSDSKPVADSYAAEVVGKTDLNKEAESKPFTLTGKLVEFPHRIDSMGGPVFSKAGFDQAAQNLKPGEILWTYGYDTGPMASLEQDPGRGYSYPSYIFATKDSGVVTEGHQTPPVATRYAPQPVEPPPLPVEAHRTAEFQYAMANLKHLGGDVSVYTREFFNRGLIEYLEQQIAKLEQEAAATTNPIYRRDLENRIDLANLQIEMVNNIEGVTLHPLADLLGRE